MKSKKIKSLLPGAVLILCIALVFYYFLNSLLDYIYLKKDFAYTVSNNVSIGTASKAGNESKYTFFLNGKWYAGFTNLPLRRDGTKYFIKFYPQNPNRNEATNIIANSEDIKNLPPDGYKKLPHSGCCWRPRQQLQFVTIGLNKKIENGFYHEGCWLGCQQQQGG